MKLRIFKCDQCNKLSEKRNEGEFCFPYELGWKYLHKLEIRPNPKLETEQFLIKLEKNNIQIMPIVQDKHFCSVSCLTKFIGQCTNEN